MQSRAAVVPLGQGERKDLPARFLWGDHLAAIDDVNDHEPVVPGDKG
jgi:hypothetical protein